MIEKQGKKIDNLLKKIAFLKRSILRQKENFLKQKEILLKTNENLLRQNEKFCYKIMFDNLGVVNDVQMITNEDIKKARNKKLFSPNHIGKIR